MTKRKVNWTVTEFNLTGCICDSQQSYEFSQLNFLLSWASSGQDEKKKINGNINGSRTFK